MPPLSGVADIFGVHADSADGDAPVCAICHDPLETAQAYTLPECQHRFHTHCIVTWFRHCHGTAYAVAGQDAPCPYCMNRGINNGANQSVERRPRRYGYGYYGGSTRVIERERLLRRYLRDRPDADGAASIVRMLDRVRAARRARTEALAEQADLRKKLKGEPVQYFEAQHDLQAARRRMFRRHTQYRHAARELLDFPVLPLIIPTPIDIN